MTTNFIPYYLDKKYRREDTPGYWLGHGRPQKTCMVRPLGTAVQLEYPEKKRNISCGSDVLMYYTIAHNVFWFCSMTIIIVYYYYYSTLLYCTDNLCTTIYLITYYIVFGWFWLWYVLQCFCSAMKRNVPGNIYFLRCNSTTGVQQYSWSTLLKT